MDQVDITLPLATSALADPVDVGGDDGLAGSPLDLMPETPRRPRGAALAASTAVGAVAVALLAVAARGVSRSSRSGRTMNDAKRVVRSRSMWPTVLASVLGFVLSASTGKRVVHDSGNPGPPKL